MATTSHQSNKLALFTVLHQQKTNIAWCITLVKTNRLPSRHCCTSQNNNWIVYCITTAKTNIVYCIKPAKTNIWCITPAKTVSAASHQPKQTLSAASHWPKQTLSAASHQPKQTLSTAPHQQKTFFYQHCYVVPAKLKMIYFSQSATIKKQLITHWCNVFSVYQSYDIDSNTIGFHETCPVLLRSK